MKEPLLLKKTPAEGTTQALDALREKLNSFPVKENPKDINTAEGAWSLLKHTLSEQLPDPEEEGPFQALLGASFISGLCFFMGFKWFGVLFALLGVKDLVVSSLLQSRANLVAECLRVGFILEDAPDEYAAQIKGIAEALRTDRNLKIAQKKILELKNDLILRGDL